MTRKIGFFVATGLVILGLGLFWLGTWRQVTISINGQPMVIRTHALMVKGALNNAKITLSPTDRVLPNICKLMGWNSHIRIELASDVYVQQSPPAYSTRFMSAERIPANLLFAAGIPLFPGDLVLWQGIPIIPDHLLPYESSQVLQVIKAIPITLETGSDTTVFYSSDATLGNALWDEGIQVHFADQLSMPLDMILENAAYFNLQPARSIYIDVDGNSIRSMTSSQTVGSALNGSGIALEGLDRSLPAEDQSIPSDGNIQIVRVKEEFILEQSTIPFTTEYVADPETELDRQSVVEDGQYGLQVSRQRIRYENGIEVSRQIKSQWIASEPKPKKIGYGTKVVVRTLDTPTGRIEYWRAITVYATAYSPCRSGTTKCYYGTSFGLPVQRGVIGVTRAWYNLMAGQGVYVPGYGKGIIADTGGGIPGKYWIDLGFTDEDFEAWHQDVTLYFLTPIPADIPWILP